MAVGLPPSRVDRDRVPQPLPQVWREGTRVVVSLHGEQDMNTAARLAAVLAAADVEGDGDLVVDLRHVEFMDAKIAFVLVRRRDALRSRSRDLTLRAPSPSARRILQIYGLLDLVEPAPVAAADEAGSGAMVGGPGTPATRRSRAGRSVLQVEVPPLRAPVQPWS
jgi:anti-sigma B factor antagonist